MPIITSQRARKRAENEKAIVERQLRDARTKRVAEESALARKFDEIEAAYLEQIAELACAIRDYDAGPAQATLDVSPGAQS